MAGSGRVWQLVEYEAEANFCANDTSLEADVVDKTFGEGCYGITQPVNSWSTYRPCTRQCWCPGLCLIECLLCYAVVKFIGYTEIDWVAYMQEVEGYLSGSAIMSY